MGASVLDANDFRQRVASLLRDFHTFEPGRHEQAINELQRMDRQPVIESLTALLKDEDGDMRADAAEALMRIDPKQMLPFVLPLLHDSDASVRRFICELLHGVADERATQPLIDLVQNDASPSVRWCAASALGTIGDQAALPALEHAVKFDDGRELAEERRVRDIAATAIEDIHAQARIAERLDDLRRRLAGVGATASVRGAGMAKFVFAEHNGRAIEASLLNGDWRIEFWAVDKDEAAAPVDDQTFADDSDAFRESAAWFTALSRPCK